MRILHTSDWHLGRSFHGVGLLDAQATFLEHLADVVRSEAVDAVVVAGDVYDRALPAVDAVTVLDDGLDALVGAGASVLVTSGNHDSATRLGFGSRRSARGGVHLRTRVTDAATPVLLEDRHGDVALYGVPYAEPALVADTLGVERGHAPVLRALMDGVRADLATRPPGTRSLVAAHAFVTGGAASDSERDISVGGVGAVPASVFDGVDYVALGHLHGRQRLTESVRYSGSPLPYSFSEHAHRKGSWLLELGAGGVERVDPVDAPVLRPLALLRGRLEDLLADASQARHEGSFCQVTLTDTQRPREAMERLRRRFPHVLALAFEPEGRPEQSAGYAERMEGLDDVDVCCAFVDHVRGAPATDVERRLLRDALEGGRLRAAEAVPAPRPGVARRGAA
ncbi:MAG TPA: exonuclease SbcCD subunit D [Actinomycetales bacterium]|nr:exonuclease SbcCD subunit D [Actinomycetales bacterium]